MRAAAPERPWRRRSTCWIQMSFVTDDECVPAHSGNSH